MTDDRFHWAYHETAAGQVTLVRCPDIDSAAAEKERLKHCGSTTRCVGTLTVPTSEAEVMAYFHDTGRTITTVRDFI